MKSLRLLLDQMIDSQVAERLSGLGHDVVRVAEIGMARQDDAQILDRAIEDNRILITLDEHFGDWVVLPLSKHPGVVRVKADPSTTERILDVLLPFLVEHQERDFDGVLAIVRSGGVRWVRTDPDAET